MNQNQGYCFTHRNLKEYSHYRLDKIFCLELSAIFGTNLNVLWTHFTKLAQSYTFFYLLRCHNRYLKMNGRVTTRAVIFQHKLTESVSVLLRVQGKIRCLRSGEQFHMLIWHQVGRELILLFCDPK